MTKNNNNSFVSLHLDATTDYAAELDNTNFNEFQTMTINLFAEDNQKVEPIKLELNIDYLNIEAQIPEDELTEMMYKVADENHEILKALVDR